MERQTQEHSGKQQFDTIHNPSKPSVRNRASLEAEEETQQDKETNASKDTQSKAISGKDQTQVAEFAYALYEQRGRKDGHDLEDWFNAEQRIMTQGRSSRTL